MDIKKEIFKREVLDAKEFTWALSSEMGTAGIWRCIIM